MGNWGSVADLGVGTVAFEIESIDHLPKNKQCFFNIYGTEDCSDEPNWIGPLDSSIAGSPNCYGPTNPATGKYRYANGLQLVCCDSLGVNCS